MDDDLHDDRIVTTRGARAVDAEPVDERGKFSIGATFLGWCAAAFLNILFIALVAGLLGGVAANVAAGGVTDAEVTNLGIIGLVGVLIATFLAYLVGGYAAGRIGHWDGMKHGAVVPVWAILFAILVAILGAGLGNAFVNVAGFGGINFGALTGAAVVSLLLTLAAMFGGAILGGMLGERGDERYLGVVERRRIVRRERPF